MTMALQAQIDLPRPDCSDHKETLLHGIKLEFEQSKECTVELNKCMHFIHNPVALQIMNDLKMI